MKVYAAVSCPLDSGSPVVRAFRGVAATDRDGVHRITEDPEQADLILFVDNHLSPDWRVRAMLDHPLLKRFPSKCMAYDERDYPWNALPGVYASMPARYFDAGSQRAWAYYTLSEKTIVPPGIRPDLLYSFVGTPGPRNSGGRRPRQAILNLQDDRCLIRDSSGFVFYDDKGNPTEHAARQAAFAETIGRSKFVLCPRGAGTSSIRMYEVMRAGRVPVIVADQWVAPVGPDWQKFSLRVDDYSVSQIPELLRQREADWEEMAAEAATQYRQWFAPDVNFHNIIEQCRSIMEAGIHVNLRLRAAGYRELRRHHAMAAARSRIGRALRALGMRK